MDKGRTLTVTLEAVTPLFLGGAEPRGEPELRAPAFRGALRYWLRAALGGVIGDNVEAMRKAEAAVFGSTDENIGSASAVTVRLTGQSSLTAVPYSQIAGWNQASKSFSHPGTAYFLFAARKTVNEQERSGLFGTFTLHLSTRPGISESEDSFRKAYAAFWLLTHFGGVGSRSRRGAGALQVIAAEGDTQVLQNLPPLHVQAATPKALVTELKQGLGTIPQLLGAKELRSPIRRPSGFDIVHPKACKIWVINKAFNNWNQALNDVGRVYQGFRSRRPPDYETVKDSLTRGAPLAQSVERAAFGLPVPFYYHSLRGARAALEAEEHDRRASPLWIRIVKLTNGAYAVVLLWFQSEFLPSGERLRLRQAGKTLSGDAPDSRLLETFIMGTDPVRHSSLKDKGLGVLEVHYA
jgi:CRISPR-associated protein Cmr1